MYNNFPFPDLDRESADDIHEKAARVLAIREQYAEVPLAWLYDDTSMPSALKNAHRELDLAVDRSYGYEFDTEKERVIFLLDLYSNCKQTFGIISAQGIEKCIVLQLNFK